MVHELFLPLSKWFFLDSANTPNVFCSSNLYPPLNLLYKCPTHETITFSFIYTQFFLTV
jgi:hypothetical protein